MNEVAAASTWSVITFFAYTAAVFLLAIISHRFLKGRKFLSEYFLGSRGLGVWALAMSYAATSASGGSFTGFPAKVYSHGWVLALWIASYMVVPVCCMGLLGKRLNQVARKSGAITLPDVLRDRFRTPRVGILVSVILALFLAFNLVAQFKAGGIILEILLGTSYQWALFIFAGGVILYTAYGGFRAVVWTDVLQGIVMFAGVLVLLPLAIYKSGGLETVTRDLAARPAVRVGEVVLEPSPGAGAAVRLPAGTVLQVRRGEDQHLFEIPAEVEVGQQAGRPTMVLIHALEPAALPAEGWSGTADGIGWWNRSASSRVSAREYRIAPRRNFVSGPGPDPDSLDGFLPLGLAISFFVMWAITGAGQPGTMVRLMAFRDTRVFRRAICAVTFYYSLIYLPLVIIFVCARHELPPLAKPDQAMARMITHLAPPILAGVLLAAPFAAIMSTVDSFLLMISSSLVRDIYQRTVKPDASPRTIRWGSYLTTGLVGVVVTIGALNPPVYLQDIIIFTGAGMASSFLAPMVLSLYWRRSTAAGIVASILGGCLTLVALYAYNWITTRSIGPYNLQGILPAVWGLVASFTAGIVVSLLTKPPPKDLVRFYFAAPTRK